MRIKHQTASFLQQVKILAINSFALLSWQPFQIHPVLRQFILFHHLLVALIWLVKTECFLKIILSVMFFTLLWINTADSAGVSHYRPHSRAVSAPSGDNWGRGRSAVNLESSAFFSQIEEMNLANYCVYYAFKYFLKK